MSEYYTEAQASKATGISSHLIRRMSNHGHFPKNVNIEENRFGYNIKEVEEWLRLRSEIRKK